MKPVFDVCDHFLISVVGGVLQSSASNSWRCLLRLRTTINIFIYTYVFIRKQHVSGNTRLPALETQPSTYTLLPTALETQPSTYTRLPTTSGSTALKCLSVAWCQAWVSTYQCHHGTGNALMRRGCTLLCVSLSLGFLPWFIIGVKQGQSEGQTRQDLKLVSNY